MEKPRAKEDVCVSYNETTKYYDFVHCTDHEYCCGKIPNEKCCPKLPPGAIFGIVLTAVVMIVIVICCIVTCCSWCDCCLYRRLRGKQKKRSKTRRRDLSALPEDTGIHMDRQTVQPLRLRIDMSVDSAEPPNSTRHADDIISIDTYAPSTPLTPTTPMSVASPSEFSKLIAHDWNRHRRKEDVDPYSDDITEDVEKVLN